MSLIYSGTTLQNVIYNDVKLSKIYYKVGDGDSVLVFATPTIYGGENGTSLFGSKSFVYYLQRTKVYVNNSTYSTFDASTMEGTVSRATSGSSYHYGVCNIVGNSTFDISEYSTITFKYDVSAPANSTLGVNMSVGLSTQCERAATSPSADGYYRLGGTQYYSQVIDIMQGTNRTHTLNLATAKAHGSEYYPYLSFAPQHLNYSRNETWTVKVKSIILS